jgi:DNA sulfur modification protein DndB
VESFEPLKGHRVAFRRQTPMAKNNVTAVTTILGLYDLVQATSRHGNGTAKHLREFMAMRPAEPIVEGIYREQVEFWTALQLRVPEVREALAAPESAKACAPFRHPEGGHVLFRPAGQKAFAKAARTLASRGGSLRTAVGRLSDVPMELASAPWNGILWDSTSQVMITKTKHVALAANVFLAVAGERPDDPATAAKYQQLTGRRLPRARRRRA